MRRILHAEVQRWMNGETGTSKSPTGTKRKRPADAPVELQTGWIQCDRCDKWRKVSEAVCAAAGDVWYCEENVDAPAEQRSCEAAEEAHKGGFVSAKAAHFAARPHRANT